MTLRPTTTWRRHAQRPWTPFALCFLVVVACQSHDTAAPADDASPPIDTRPPSDLEHGQDGTAQDASASPTDGEAMPLTDSPVTGDSEAPSEVYRAADAPAPFESESPPDTGGPSDGQSAASPLDVTSSQGGSDALFGSDGIPPGHPPYASTASPARQLIRQSPV